MRSPKLCCDSLPCASIWLLNLHCLLLDQAVCVGLPIMWTRLHPEDYTWDLASDDVKELFLHEVDRWAAGAEQTPNVGLRLTGGREHLLTNTLSVTCTLQASPLDSPTPVFRGRTEFCSGLGACQGPITPEWEPPDSMHDYFKSVFIRTECSVLYLAHS